MFHASVSTSKSTKFSLVNFPLTLVLKFSAAFSNQNELGEYLSDNSTSGSWRQGHGCNVGSWICPRLGLDVGFEASRQQDDVDLVVDYSLWWVPSSPLISCRDLGYWIRWVEGKAQTREGPCFRQDQMYPPFLPILVGNPVVENNENVLFGTAFIPLSTCW